MITIQRTYLDNCTTGIMTSDQFSKKIFTLELVDLDNETSVSCIPEGLYNCSLVNSPSLGLCINIRRVIGRTYIRIHAGNHTTQIEGCILVGDGHKDFNNDGVIDVTNSRDSLEWLTGWIDENIYDSFKLKIM